MGSSAIVAGLAIGAVGAVSMAVGYGVVVALAGAVATARFTRR